MGNKVSGRPEDRFPFLPTVEQEHKLCQQTSKKDLLNGQHANDSISWLDSVVLSRSQSGTTLSDVKRRPRHKASVPTNVLYEPVIEEKAEGDEQPDDDDNRKGEPRMCVANFIIVLEEGSLVRVQSVVSTRFRVSFISSFNSLPARLLPSLFLVVSNRLLLRHRPTPCGRRQHAGV